ncbi:unnamed protein product [Tilletia laevis]|uniref:FAM192A/Fyv6 N-terminal domain-containing protein n=3 Tax=Tilletia TaxID=13289 RepID=A0A8X7T109_9BASI|nr:hypothetical protein CF336_g267 [Tilletia laevis]KAE8205538.1 hypothetical protein CF328_g435 [Tilletia controversa]KAE8265492.1 hypothetical protein A4X03_0g227 [Tilletia caries]KAE8208728.1 hypothetical protein CF335_g188 [Tilletia laevis]KAE8256149.1 hypothetical protein A4X06_0g37 [Tilletia controversa]
MADPFKPGPSVASRFVSQTELSEAQARREADVRAAYARLGQDAPAEALAATKGDTGAEYDPRSLFERLQANKNAKQEKIDEMLKLSNQFRGLDEDETVFLAEVAADKRAEEAMKRSEEEQELLEFRRATLVRAPSPTNPLALLTGSALSTSPAPPPKAAFPNAAQARIGKAAMTSPSAPVAGVKRSADEVAGEDVSKRVKGQEQGVGGSSAGPSRPAAGAGAGSSGTTAAARKKKAAAALGIVRKKPSK